MDRYGDHAVKCSLGPCVAARHAGMRQVTADACTRAGYATLQEQAVPEFPLRTRYRDGVQVTEEAFLDVEAFHHAVCGDILIDVSFRLPTAKHCIKAAAATPGAATLKAVEDKLRRYPTTRGRAVTTAAMEAWGRLGDEFDEQLNELARAAATRQRERAELPTSWGNRWRQQLSTIAASSVAKCIRLSSHRDDLGALLSWPL